MSYDEAFRRATSSLPKIGAGAARVPRDHEIALVELVFEEVQHGERRPQSFLALPPHLGGETEVRGLIASTASKDAMMRADVFEWAQINRDIAAANAQSLRVLAEAYCKATTLLADATTDVDERRLQTWRANILAYALHTFEADLRECPSEHEARVWCVVATATGNPVFDFVYEAASGQRRAPWTKPAPKTARELFGGAIGHKPDRTHDDGE